MYTQNQTTHLKYSRRGFFVLAGAGLYTVAHAATLIEGVTARQVIERIQKNVGVEWRKDTVDTFKIGNPDTIVKGIATSFSATLDVCQRAHAAGRNLLIVHEPTFYNHNDETASLSGEIYETKRNFIEKNGLVVWRFHDHWHARKPDGILAGMTEALGWGKYAAPEQARRFSLPSTTLEALARSMQSRLNARALRVIGDPRMTVRRVVLMPGFNNFPGIMRTLNSPDVDVLVIGETREWEGIEYARDCVTAGKRKGLIVLGHVPSEERGMEECAKWLKTFITEVPIQYLPGGDPFWRPKL
ncbi:MAG: Nif3-like dinuclear metal center hexameric protein [Acidobacteriota bacterium]|nr:Nif3-like dinuclear metal center hexameric protein [Acidobacteriota bacterium]